VISPFSSAESADPDEAAKPALRDGDHRAALATGDQCGGSLAGDVLCGGLHLDGPHPRRCHLWHTSNLGKRVPNRQSPGKLFLLKVRLRSSQWTTAEHLWAGLSRVGTETKWCPGGSRTPMLSELRLLRSVLIITLQRLTCKQPTMLRRRSPKIFGPERVDRSLQAEFLGGEGTVRLQALNLPAFASILQFQASLATRCPGI